MKLRTIFFGENDNLYKEIAQQGLITSENDKSFIIAEYIEHLSKRNLSSYTGYFKYISNDTIYEIYIVPKTIKHNICTKYNLVNKNLNAMNENQKIECKQLVIEYIKECLILLQKNDKDYRAIKGIDIKYKYMDKSDFEEINIDELIYEYYKLILIDVRKKIDKYYNYVYIERVQNCKNTNSSQIDVYKSIVNPDKSNIYITDKKEILNIDIMNVVYNAIEIFKSTRIKNLTFNNEIIDIACKIQKLIKKKFNYKYSAINEEKIISIFTKYKFNSENQKKLYKNIILLLGYEEIELDYNKNIEIMLKYKYKLKNIDYKIINSEKVYEYKVYEYCKKRWQMCKIDMCNSKENTLYTYKYREKTIYRKKYSKPDIVVYDGNTIKAVVDAKWKVLKNIKEDIKEEDIYKISRDSYIWGNGLAERHLVYPIIPEGYNGITLDFKLKGIMDYSNKVQINECN